MLVTLAPTSTTASGPCSPSGSAVPAERSAANDVRSTVVGAQAGLLGRADRAEDHLLAGGDEQAPDRVAGVVDDLLQLHEVEDGLVDRERDEVGHLELERVLQLVRRHPGDLDQAYEHLLVRDPEHDVLLAELHTRPEGADRFSDGIGVDDLAVADNTRRQGHLTEAVQRDLALVDGDLGGAHTRGTDVEPDGGTACHGFHPSPATADSSGIHMRFRPYGGWA